MPVGFEPSLEVEPGRVRRVGTREAAGDEAQPVRFRPYCVRKALPLMHRRACTPRRAIFVGN
jgi:hypothetical protein